MEKELNEIITIIQSHKDKAYRKINEELVLMYFEIGKYLSTKIKTEKWGSKIVENISRKIMELHPYQLFIDFAICFISMRLNDCYEFI